MIAVAAFITTMNFFASADTSAAASAFGVSTNPARMSTLSRTTSSCAWRLATSGATPPVSLRMISIFLPATVSPCSFIYSLMALSICVAASANWPEYGRIRPILTGCCACAGDAARAASAAKIAAKCRFMVCPPPRATIARRTRRRKFATRPAAGRGSLGLDVRHAHDLGVLAYLRAHEPPELRRRVSDRLGTERLQALAERGIGERRAHFRVQAVEDFRRRVRRREHAEPASMVLEAGHAGLGRGGNIGHLRVALRVGVGERAHPAALQVLENRRRRREHHLRLARDRRRHRGAGPLVGDV